MKSKKLSVDGRTDVHLRPTLLGRHGGVDLKMKLAVLNTHQHLQYIHSCGWRTSSKYRHKECKITDERCTIRIIWTSEAKSRVNETVL